MQSKNEMQKNQRANMSGTEMELARLERDGDAVAALPVHHGEGDLAQQHPSRHPSRSAGGRHHQNHNHDAYRDEMPREARRRNKSPVENDYSNQTQDNERKRRRKRFILLLIAAVAIVAGATLGGIYGAQHANSRSQPDTSSIPPELARCVGDGIDLSTVGDGICNLGPQNTPECNFDDSDCMEFNLRHPNFWKQFPDCRNENTNWIGDGDICDEELNVMECNYDAGDCADFNTYEGCDVDEPSWIGDGKCGYVPGDQNPNVSSCGYDGGDCSQFNRRFPDCYDDGLCESFANEFPDCRVEYKGFIGDFECDGEDYNTIECGFDGGDCIEFNARYPDCDVPYPAKVGNGMCGMGKYNTVECGYDGGDCL